MNKVALFDAKPYDMDFFERYAIPSNIEIQYLESRLTPNTYILAQESEAVIAFVNDRIDAKTIDRLCSLGVGAIALRSAGFNNVDLKHARGKIKIYRVPAYSPNAVAEHAMALLLCLNRKIHRAYNRVREFNFGLRGLTGFDLRGKTMGVIGTGKIGQCFIDISLGFGMKVLAFDPYPIDRPDIKYVELEELFKASDVIALHCPLTKDNQYIINKESLHIMKDGVYIINTSRGALIDTEALLEALKTEKVAGAALDVYEEEADVFFEDLSETVVNDDTLKLLIANNNVLLTAHQAFLTNEALDVIARTTIQNLRDFFDNKPCENEVKYKGK